MLGSEKVKAASRKVGLLRTKPWVRLPFLRKQPKLSGDTCGSNLTCARRAMVQDMTVDGKLAQLSMQYCVVQAKTAVVSETALPSFLPPLIVATAASQNCATSDFMIAQKCLNYRKLKRQRNSIIRKVALSTIVTCF